jgi:hypothetical protein
MEQVGSKLEFALNNDTPELREKADQVLKLREAIKKTSKEQVIDKVTYTWFNRFMALRFMDANDYQPIGMRVLTPKDGYTLPEILDEAKQGNISDELSVKNQRIFDLLDGKIPSANGQNEAYKELLIGSCNHLNKVFPFLFERINDYTELLLPDDLISELSIVNDIREGMTIEDCLEVEVVGWLYQFYISEKNVELISSKNVYKKHELAPASQLFTPKWIVQYMVENTLGQLWSEIYPSTKILSELEYYIKPSYEGQLRPRDKKSIEEIKFFEPCTGSGHILSYAFDIFYKIYEEQGYNPTEIPELIITKNLFGVDIDQRAAQLASFVLLMKGRQKHRRFLKAVETKNIQPNISFYQDFEFDEKFKNASAIGSLIKVEPNEVRELKIDDKSLFGERQLEVKKLYELLGQRYDVVVTNPPYINSSRMEGSLKQYVEVNYPETKSDLFATFILRCLELCNDEGLTGYMTPFVWMFISSYEKLRENIINKHFINNLIQLEYSGFDGATVPICTFTLRNKNISDSNGSYIRLSKFRGSQNQAPKTREAIKNNDCGWFYTINQSEFKKIIGSPIGYWLSTFFLEIFSSSKKLKDIAEPRTGLQIGDNDRFIRNWAEVPINDHSAFAKDAKWYPYNKGGMFCKWYGNANFVIDWYQDGMNIKNDKLNKLERGLCLPSNSKPKNQKYYFRQCGSWTKISSSKMSVRYFPESFLFDIAGSSVFAENETQLFNLIAFLNSKVAMEAISIISPTLNYQPGDVGKLPIAEGVLTLSTHSLARECVQISKLFWDSNETSWDFLQNELIRIKGQDIEESYDLYQHFWKNKFFQLQKDEEEINRQFIETYGLQDELQPHVPLEDITILKEETSIDNGELVFKGDEIFKTFISYSVGCMFGRYSLDNNGLILANQGDTLEEYFLKVRLSKEQLSFIPDEDNIIPILDDEWFEDDIAGRFHEFLKATFGLANYEKNLAFIEECLGKDIRKYLVKDFYKDHIKRYKNRPIYWMFSSPKGSFNVLIYMHRYTPDTLNKILNNYLIEYREKLKTRMEHLDHVIVSGTSTEQNKAEKEKDKLKLVLIELQEYERDILYPLATERININLDDGVIVNYNKFGKAIKEVMNLNDKATKKKVREFDWINVEEIR